MSIWDDYGPGWHWPSEEERKENRQLLWTWFTGGATLDPWEATNTPTVEEVKKNIAAGNPPGQGLYWPEGVEPEPTFPPAEDPDAWVKKFLYGEALVAGTLILAPTILDILAAFAADGKKTKKHDPKIFADGLRHASETFRDTTERAMPTIMAGLTNPAFALPFIYINLEALHKAKLIDSGIAHTIEPIMIGSTFLDALGRIAGAIIPNV